MIKRIVLAITTGILLLSASNSFAASDSLARIKTVGFESFDSVPDYVSNDEAIIKGMYYATKDESNRVKSVKIDYNTVGSACDAYITGNITRYDYSSYWREPSAYTIDKVVSSEKRKWKDAKGNEKTMRIDDYESEICDSKGGHVFTAHATAGFYLVDSSTGEVLVSHVGEKSDDKPMDAFRHILKEFYKKVEKEIKDSKKLYGK